MGGRAYATMLIRFCLTNPWMWAAALVLSVALCTGLLVDWYDEGQTHDLFAVSTYEWILMQEHEAEGMSFSPEYQELSQQRLEAAQQAAHAQTPSEFYAAVSRFCEVRWRMGEAGYISGDSLARRAEYELAHRVAALDLAAKIPATSREAPALYHMASAVHYVPYILWHVPAVLLVVLVSRLTRNGGLCAKAPVGICASLMAELGAVGFMLTVVVAAAWLPSVVWAAVGNGLGTVTYPVVFIQDGHVAVATVGGVLAKTYLLGLLGSLIVYAAGRLGAVLTHTPAYGAGIALVVLLVPAFCGFMGLPLLACGFLSILDISQVTGWATTRPLSVALGPDFATGCAMGGAVLLGLAALLGLPRLVRLVRLRCAAVAAEDGRAGWR